MARTLYVVRCRVTRSNGAVSTIEHRVHAETEFEAIRSAEDHYGRDADVKVLTVRSQ
jgi:hypothetical protein